MILCMKAADIGRIAEIHVFGQRKAYRGILTDEWLFGETTVAKRTEYFKKQLENPRRAAFVYYDGIIKGFFIAAPCPDEGKAHALELERIFVEPLMQGQGIGKKLLLYCEEMAARLGFPEICLWVLEKNHAARGFYEKMGYALDGSRQGSRQGLMGIPVMEVRYAKNLK